MTQSFSLEVTNDHIAYLKFDTKENSVNLFTTSTLLQLQTYLIQLKKEDTLKALVIFSGKSDSFIVGSKIQEILTVENTKELKQTICLGQTVCTLMESLPFPTLAAIHGSCLGGGLEIALACEYRLASIHPQTSLALPEVELGILPAWGGTQRLPRIIEFNQAVSLISGGAPITTYEAYKIGLIDGIFSPSLLKEQVSSFLLQPQSRKYPSNTFKSHHLYKKVVCFFAKKRLLKHTKGNYPAPLKVLDILKRNLSFNQGLEEEFRVISELLEATVAQNLIKLFLTQDQLKKDKEIHRPIMNCAILGGGVMGSGLSWTLARHEVPVRLKELNYQSLSKAHQNVYKLNQQQSKNGKLHPYEGKLLYHRLNSTIHYTGMQKVDLVIEATFENLESKKQVFEELEPFISPQCIVGSTTSSIPLHSMVSSFTYPERFVGLHFFNSEPKQSLVEVVVLDTTSTDSLEKVLSFLRKIKKTPIVVKDCPGFLVNRILIMGILEALTLLQEGVDQRYLDKSMQRFGLPMGPCLLADEVGLDIILHLATSFEKHYGKRMYVPKLLEQIVEHGFLGRKTGNGFYLFDDKNKHVNPNINQILGIHQIKNMSEQKIVQRILLAMVNEASRCLEEKISEDPEQIDLAMVLGAAFPSYLGGPMKYIERRGKESIKQELLSLAENQGKRFEPSAYFK
jgi:3-hydroxyacyl-CoA dehydrogenase/enoyl-CoA hydratase/3-hydroxybutyryl-CoA epimerase